MKILFYTPLNNICRDIESQANIFAAHGHNIHLLTQLPPGQLNAIFKNNGYVVSSGKKQIRYMPFRILQQLFDLIRFCWKFKIDIVYSHLEPANFIAVLGQFFIRGKVIVCRHHIDEAKLYGFDTNLSYRLTYRLAKKVIVVSEHALDYMVKQERISSKKIYYIPLSYDFNLNGLPNEKNVSSIKNNYKAEILLLTVCRFTKYKRPELSVEVIDALNKSGINAKLVILGWGELAPDLQELIRSKKLDDKVFLAGYVDNVLDYMAASDLLIHPSVLDSSCISVKEASLVKLPVIVCEGVGDFDSYIINEINGFRIKKDMFVKECVSIVQKLLRDINLCKVIGNNLKNTVFARFDINKTYHQYEEIHKEFEGI